MTRSSNDTTPISVSEQLGTMLMLRSAVSPLFRKIAENRPDRVIVDFANVEFMSRSFAHEYLSAKASSRRTIEETNVPMNVRKMLDLVSSHLVSARDNRRSRSLVKRDPRRATLRPTRRPVELPAGLGPVNRSTR